MYGSAVTSFENIKTATAIMLISRLQSRNQKSFDDITVAMSIFYTVCASKVDTKKAMSASKKTISLKSSLFVSKQSQTHFC